MARKWRTDLVHQRPHCPFLDRYALTIPGLSVMSHREPSLSARCMLPRPDLTHGLYRILQGQVVPRILKGAEAGSWDISGKCATHAYYSTLRSLL